MFGYDFDVNN
jgi:hypothetical protein